MKGECLRDISMRVPPGQPPAPRPGLWHDQSPSGDRKTGMGSEPVQEGRDPRVPSSIKADCGQLGHRACSLCERRGLFYCRTLEIEGAAESRSVSSSSQNKVMGAGSTWDLVKSGASLSPGDRSAGPGEARHLSPSVSTTCSSAWRQRKGL